MFVYILQKAVDVILLDIDIFEGTENKINYEIVNFLMYFVINMQFS